MEKKPFNLKAMDSKTRANSGIDHELQGPDGEGTGVFITVIGRDAEDFQKAARAMGAKALDKFAKTRKFSANPEQTDRDQLDLLVLATRGWYTLDVAGKREPRIALGDEALEYSAENARRLYRELPAVRDQMQEVVDDRANFLMR